MQAQQGEAEPPSRPGQARSGAWGPHWDLKLGYSLLRVHQAQGPWQRRQDRCRRVLGSPGGTGETAGGRAAVTPVEAVTDYRA